MSAIVARIEDVLEALRDVEPAGKDKSLRTAYRSGEQKVYGTGAKLTPDEKAARRVHPVAGHVGKRSAALRVAHQARAEAESAKTGAESTAAHKKMRAAIKQASSAHKDVKKARSKMTPTQRKLNKKKFTPSYDLAPKIKKKVAAEKERAEVAKSIRARRAERSAELIGKRHAKEAPFLPGEVERAKKDVARKKRERTKEELKKKVGSRPRKNGPPPLPPTASSKDVTLLPSKKEKARTRRERAKTIRAVRGYLQKGA
jgi:hypothetical protein